jgi:uncharacterized tellurite resistance protein B-like protein
LRTYPINSPQASARIVALAMLADGNFCKTELDVLERLDADAQLGLESEELKAIVRTLCEDLFYSSHGSWGPTNVDSGTLNALLGEIDDPELRVKVLGLCVAVTEADEHIAEGEMQVLAAASALWGLPYAELQQRKKA